METGFLVIELIATLAAAAAAIFAGWTASKSTESTEAAKKSADASRAAVEVARETARAAKETVEEARLARRDAIAPRLVLTRNFTGFVMSWPSEGNDILPSFKTNGQEPQPLSFDLTNYGGPALEVRLNYHLDDPEGNISQSDRLTELGIRFNERPVSFDIDHLRAVQYPRKDGSHVTVGLQYDWSGFFASCAPQQTLNVLSPYEMLNTIFVRGLHTTHHTSGRRIMRLTITIDYFDIDGAHGQIVFAFEIIVLLSGNRDPAVVTGGIKEKPIYRKPPPIRHHDGEAAMDSEP